jgi:hypothetical protein
MASKRQSPDADIAGINYLGLNATFYETRPHDYFQHRLSSLLLVAGKRAELEILLNQGLTVGTLRSFGEGFPEGTDEERAKAAEVFVTTETEVLGHHVGETLLRLYLAHEAIPPCPWLELSRLRNPGGFKEQVRQRFGPDTDVADPGHRDAVARVFYLSDSREGLAPPPPEAAWSESLAVIEEYLRHFARQFLGGASLYNAAKHGLAVMPGKRSARLGDKPIISADGPSIEYLYVRDRGGGDLRWNRGTHWVRMDLQLALIIRACQIIEALWKAARYRYVPSTRGGGWNLSFIGRPGPVDLLRSVAKSGSIGDLGVELYYDRPEMDPEAGGSAGKASQAARASRRQIVLGGQVAADKREADRSGYGDGAERPEMASEDVP